MAIITVPPAKAANNAQTIKLVAFGDSLTAGYGLAAAESFPQQLEKALQEKGYNVQVQNAGVSGDTTAGGLARLDWSLAQPVDGIIVELGANDALRGTDPSATRTSLDAILKRLNKRNIDILVAGMLAPPNLGADFGNGFNSIFPELSLKHHALLYPFFLEGVAGKPSLLQADGLHPTGEGVKIIVQNILISVEQLIKNIKQRRNSQS